MNNTALVTGASSGIGNDLAHIHAEKGSDLVVVARREEKLNRLREILEDKHGIQVKVIAKDLARENACREIFDAFQKEGIEVEYLINNAGFGGRSKFHEQKFEHQQGMIDLNIKALTELTRLFLPGMVERDRGRILQVASTAGLVAGPLQAVYYASKAYVISLSQAIAEELSGTGVTCTVLCPGVTQSEFIKRADLENTLLVKSGVASSRSVAEKGLLR